MKAKYSPRVLLFLLPFLPFFFLALRGFLGYLFDYNFLYPIYRTRIEYFYCLIAGLIPCWLIFLGLSFKLKISSIDGSSQIIVIKNTFTRRSRSYSFSELDGYEDTVKRYGGRGGSFPFKAIRIIKDRKPSTTADSFFYSNLDELRDELNNLKYLGINSDWRID